MLPKSYEHPEFHFLPLSLSFGNSDEPQRRRMVIINLWSHHNEHIKQCITMKPKAYD
jgi:hypothetical protein